LGVLQPADLKAAFASTDPALLGQACRLAESFQGTAGEAEAAALLAGLKAPQTSVARQQAASRGVFRGPGQDVARGAWLNLVANAAKTDPLFRDMAMSGLAGVESQILEVALARKLSIVPELIRASAAAIKTPADLKNLVTTLTGPSIAEKERLTYLTQTAQSIASRRQAAACASLLEQASKEVAWRTPVLKGFVAAGKTKGFKKIPVFPAPALLAQPGKDKLLQEAAAIFDLSGKAPVQYLKTAEHKQLYATGQVEFNKLCATCHHPEGKGIETLAPPLIDSEWALGPDRRLTALVMEGLMGPIEVNGTVYDVPKVQPVMPGIRFNPELTDEKIAGILTYIRNSWENGAPPVSPAVVKAWRESEAPRAPFTAKELLKLR
jgi:mono/diheme cytochrome c family protein